MTKNLKSNLRVVSVAGLILVLLLGMSHPALASTTGGGLPMDGWFTKVINSLTGPFAFSVSVAGIIGSGAALIFGGELSGFLKVIIGIVLALSLVIGAKATVTAITGKGAEITPFAVQKRVGQ
ncbi:MAG: TrbC/VirB2 family protein [Legionella sp.]|uniref:TrbC/VirB2 family protein n=1 Tax=Legionella sp. TaxID=459 RepID=UPI0039E25BEE